MIWRNVVVALVALCVSLPMIAAPAWAQSDCPRSAATVGKDASLTCRCSPESLKAGAVFGSARYTDDSSVCRAALHAGAVKETGGTITVHGADGCPTFVGSSANEMRSNNWGQATAKTFAFAKPAPACGLATVADALKPGSSAAAAPTQAAAPAGAAPKPTGNPADACPANAMALAPGTAQTCTCAADKIGGMGFLYGTARYTPDSSICRAAAHAGAVAVAGGPIVFHVVEGCPASTGSDSNGIKSAAWGSPAPKTVVFAHPAPACGLASVAAAPKPIVAAGAPAAPPANVADCPRSMNAGNVKTPG